MLHCTKDRFNLEPLTPDPRSDPVHRFDIENETRNCTVCTAALDLFTFDIDVTPIDILYIPLSKSNIAKVSGRVSASTEIRLKSVALLASSPFLIGSNVAV